MMCEYCGHAEEEHIPAHSKVICDPCLAAGSKMSNAMLERSGFFWRHQFEAHIESLPIGLI